MHNLKLVKQAENQRLKNMNRVETYMYIHACFDSVHVLQPLILCLLDNFYIINLMYRA